MRSSARRSLAGGDWTLGTGLGTETGSELAGGHESYELRLWESWTREIHVRYSTCPPVGWGTRADIRQTSDKLGSLLQHHQEHNHKSHLSSAFLIRNPGSNLADCRHCQYTRSHQQVLEFIKLEISSALPSPEFVWGLLCNCAAP